jgi:isopenicillin N synthase-like dioxygenase
MLLDFCKILSCKEKQIFLNFKHDLNVLIASNPATFLQLINHGVDEAVIQKMKDNTVHFFELPLEDKNAVAVCPDGGIEGFGHHFRTSADKLDWAENLIVETQPIERRKLEFWPSNPPTFRSLLHSCLILSPFYSSSSSSLV